MRIGLFCGCFDPIHLGHIRAAEACRSSAGLERVLFVPASDKYGKAGLSMQSGLHRLDMCRLALNNCEGFDVCPFELESPDAPYTSETAAYVQGLYPGAELYLCLGEDAARYAMRWSCFEELKSGVRFLVIERGGAGKEVVKALSSAGAIASEVPLEPDGVSSTAVRRKLTRGEDYIPELDSSVYRYIREKSLYV